MKKIRKSKLQRPSQVGFQRLEKRNLLATLVVDTLIDNQSPVEDGLVSLREAIQAANTDLPFLDAPAGSGVDTIVFASDILNGTIDLDEAQLDVTSSLILEGAVTIDAGKLSRHFTVEANSFELDGLTLANGLADQGGSVLMLGGSPIVANSVNFEGNVATSGNGGAVHSESGNASFVESSFTSNSASNSGGGIYSASGTVVVESSRFEGNSATISGGAIEVLAGSLDAGSTTFDNSENVPNAIPEFGGFISIGETASALFFHSTEFESGVASQRGGAVASAGGRIDISSVNFLFNEAAGAGSGGTQGGAIYSSGVVNVSRGAFRFNRADSGGAIYVDGSRINASGSSSFQSNLAIDGGAIRLVDGVLDSDATFILNTGLDTGGGISLENSTATIRFARFSNNVSGEMSDADTPIRPGAGGAIYAKDSNINLSSATMQSNIAYGRGGGIFLDGGELRIETATFTGNSNARGDFQVNDAPGGTALGMGGAIAASNATLVLREITFERNAADLFPARGGGAVYGDSSNVQVVDSTFVGNSSVVDGGAILVENESELRVLDSYFSQNVATLRGGAISVAEASEAFVIRSEFVRGNRALSHGGGAIANRGTVRVRDSFFRSNVAGSDASNAGFGGSILNLGTARVVNGSHISNRANRGGAVFSTGTLYFSNAFVGNNTATSELNSELTPVGGAVFSAGRSTLFNLSFIANQAHNGGALGISGGSTYARNLQFGGANAEHGNRATNGGAVWVGDASFQLGDSRFDNNSASRNGGGISITGSEANVLFFGHTAFRANSAELDGGAVMVARGLFDFRSGVFDRNASNSNGAAISVGSEGESIVRSSNFNLNSAEGLGGAIFNAGKLLAADCRLIDNLSGLGTQLDTDGPEENTRLVRVIF